MPEGDAVRRTAARLDRALAGQVLTASDLRVPQCAAADLGGATVRRTATHGKHLLTELVTASGHDVTLHTHLKMEGRWRVVRAGARLPGPEHQVRVVLATAQVQAVGLNLGIVELLPTSEQPTIVGHLGPDLLGTWTSAEETEALRRLLAVPERPLGEALLDQRVVAGMGTIWVAEACFVHGAHPRVPVGQLRDPERFLRRTRTMMRAAVEHGKPTTTGDRRQPLWVYGRDRSPCLRCSTTLLSGALGEGTRRRTTYWCPSCQPLG